MEQIAIYLRLSKEDEFVKDESNSITNQRAFIRGFINKNKELRKVSVMEFVDDGYSGKNMDRPDMQRMLELVKRKQISCIIVKDFSRFSRQELFENALYNLTGKLIHNQLMLVLWTFHITIRCIGSYVLTAATLCIKCQ